MSDNPTLPNTPESDTELREKIAKMAGLIELPESVFLPVDQLLDLIRKDREAVAREARIDELKQLESHHYTINLAGVSGLDVVNYSEIKDRLGALNQQKQKGGEDE